MSTALAVASVTAVLRGMLEAWLIAHDANAALGGADAEVTAVAPDTIELSGANAGPRLNLFLHQVSLNPGWRNVDLPSTSPGGVRTTHPPLALDLHYLLTAYGPRPLQSEVLLGYGMQLLHESGVLGRRQIEDLLPPELADSGLGRQVEMLRVTPEVMGTEELSKLWSALQARYRPTVAYQVTVVLIDSAPHGQGALPVLTRGALDAITGQERGILVVPDLSRALPGITAVYLPGSAPGAIPGATVSIEGHRLNEGIRRIRLENRQLDLDFDEPALPGTNPTEVSFTVPSGAAVGIYTVCVVLTPALVDRVQRTNRLALTIVPNIVTPFPIDVVRDAQGTASVQIDVSPDIRVTQRASLLVGSREVPAEPHPSTTGSLTFLIERAEVGDHLVRLRVDDIDSLIIDRSARPPTFVDHRVRIT